MKFSYTAAATLAMLVSIGATAQTTTTTTSGGRGTATTPRPTIKPTRPLVVVSPQQRLQAQITNGSLPSGYVIPQGFVGSLPPGYRVP